MRVNQFFISESVKFAKDFYREKYNLWDIEKSGGYKKEEPCLFVGIYRPEDMRRILNHKGMRIVVWGGQDAQQEVAIEIVSMLENTINVSQSHWITAALKKHGIEPKFVALPHTNVDYWKPCPLGDKIYAYAPNDVYGKNVIEEILRIVPFEAIVTTSPKQHPQERILEFYKESFIGLRLRQFDGISATVQQMGLMGRRTVWNGKTPSAIAWDRVSDIVMAVNREAEKRGTEQPQVAEATYNYLCRDDSWLEV